MKSIPWIAREIRDKLMPKPAKPRKRKEKVFCDELTSKPPLPHSHLEFLQKHCENGLNSKMWLLHSRFKISAGMGAVLRPFYAVIMEVFAISKNDLLP